MYVRVRHTKSNSCVQCLLSPGLCLLQPKMVGVLLVMSRYVDVFVCACVCVCVCECMPLRVRVKVFAIQCACVTQPHLKNLSQGLHS